MNKKMETDFEILTSQSRLKMSEDKDKGWSLWGKDECKYTWNSKSKEFTFTYSNGYITTYKNCVVDGLKITVTYDIEDWEQNPRVLVIDFSDENIIREHIEFDSRQHTKNGNWIVNRASLDAEFRVKK